MIDFPETPEHDKLKNVQEQSQWLGGFLEFLQRKRYSICQISKDEHGDERLYYVGKSIEAWLADFFEIDLKKIDAEKKAILDYIREKNKK